MKIWNIKKIVCAIFVFSFVINSFSAEIKGNIIAIGGGKRPQAVMEKIVALGGGKNAIVGIIPIASGEYRRAGKDYKKTFLKLGVKKVEVFYGIRKSHVDKEGNLEKLSKCSVIYFGGGDQRKLTAVYNGTKALNLIKKMYVNGAVIAGTSAGTAVLSEIMITGDGKWDVIQKGKVKVSKGFGFIKNYIIDQHFVARSRMNRLMSVCLTYKLPGIGIDEATALWIKNGKNVEVIGNYSVILFHPSIKQIKTNGKDENFGAKNMKIDLLLPGETFQLQGNGEKIKKLY